MTFGPRSFAPEIICMYICKTGKLQTSISKFLFTVALWNRMPEFLQCRAGRKALGTILKVPSIYQCFASFRIVDYFFQFQRSEFYLDRQCRCRAVGNSHRSKDGSIHQELRTRGHLAKDERNSSIVCFF